ncbi:hypothetical protein [Gloeocapsopsis dulcis]|uniref:Uncharacterized protein n=1 Tax=Gloeocapsopsis dulcis AAB1 = 1H9 TaxID=1433147 RepID=A0A6N8G0A2_9CHRO|nr:hypothetical protein [Gloeocapsopsis dulcis]MUL38424.1 hypothetical protein [Gloeocapsopsis dulcis AAB1 = 1H9]WNN89754.1 hypothetical protein P0S91_01260 [Gloeocapsopsis dulcis]
MAIINYLLNSYFSDNLEGCHPIEARLPRIILVIAIACTSAIMQGLDIRASKIEHDICRPKAAGRIQRRHSNF